jgi:hypothetical protein
VDDYLRLPCLRALCTLLAVDPRACAAANGPKCLLDAALDPAVGAPLADRLLVGLVACWQTPDGRRVLRVDAEVQRLLAPFTDLDLADQGGLGDGGGGLGAQDVVYLSQHVKVTRADRLGAGQRALLLLAQTHAGLSLLAANPFGLADLFRLLADPSTPNVQVNPIVQRETPNGQRLNGRGRGVFSCNVNARLARFRALFLSRALSLPF